MGIVDRIRHMLGKSGAGLSDEARLFIESIAAADIWVLAVGIRGTPSIPRIANDRAMDAITDHRIDVSEIGDDDSVFPFNYVERERQLLPFFRSEHRAREFASSLGSSVVQVFQPLKLLAGFVTSPENDEFDLILDPATPEERRITLAERRLLRSRSVAAQRSAGR